MSGCMTAPTRDVPPAVFYDWGACLFEGCTYQEWDVVKAASAYNDRSESSGVAFTLEKGDKAQGVTGVVITTKYGIVKVLEPIELGYSKEGSGSLSLKKGDVLYELHSVGEGNSSFWYKGGTYSDSLFESNENPSAQETRLKVESCPETRWGVKVNNASGLEGWVDQPREVFGNMDRHS